LLSRDEALAKVKDKLKNDRLVKHSLAVEAIMRKLAERLGEDENLWGLVGLLHDLDYEETSNIFTGLKPPKCLQTCFQRKPWKPLKATTSLREPHAILGFARLSRLQTRFQALSSPRRW